MPVERIEGFRTDRGDQQTSGQEAEEELERGLLLTTLDKAVSWGRKQSMWPMTFGLACCAIEMITTGTS